MIYGVHDFPFSTGHDHRFGAVGQKIALALFVDDPQRDPYPKEALRPDSRRAPGELRVDDGDHGGALFPCAAPARQGGGEAACWAGTARATLSADQPAAGRSEESREGKECASTWRLGR